MFTYISLINAYIICLDLFAELLPVRMHQALSSFEVRRNEVVNAEISVLREMTQVLNR